VRLDLAQRRSGRVRRAVGHDRRRRQAAHGPAHDIGYAGANGLYCSAAEADWTAVAGAHVAAGSWTLPGSPLHSCAMVVQP